MSKNNLSSNLFKRLFIEKSYVTSFNADKSYKFEWKIESYNVLGKTSDGDYVLDVKILIIDGHNLKMTIFKKYFHKQEMELSIRRKLDVLSQLTKIRIKNLTIL